MRFKILISFLFFFVINLAAQPESNFTKDIRLARLKHLNDIASSPKPPLDSAERLKIRHFPNNEKYLVDAIFTSLPKEKPFDMPTSSGQTSQYRKKGYLTFKIDGKQMKLFCYENLKLVMIPKYKYYIFLPFKDLTNKTLTYGGGRYIDFQLEPFDKNVKIDFNRAYNPYCAYKSGYSCPIVADENKLSVKIEAGELIYNADH
jgi:uncharacterized protein